jgi:hypothetical protein
MQINLTVDSAPLILRLKNGERRLAYAVVKAINRTALAIQAAEFIEVNKDFTIRRPVFWFGTSMRPGGAAARISPFASVPQGRPWAEIAIAPPAGRGLINRRTLLALFETGGRRTPMVPGAQHVAIPRTGGPARPAFGELIPETMTFAGLHFTAWRGGRRVTRKRERLSRSGESLFGTEGRVKEPERAGGTQWKGRYRTFIVLGTKEGFPGAVLQRTGPLKTDVRVVYVFRSPMELQRRLRWIATALRVADLTFHDFMEAEAISAIAHAGGEGL